MPVPKKKLKPYSCRVVQADHITFEYTPRSNFDFYLGWDAIAERLGISRTTVLSWYKRLSLPVRRIDPASPVSVVYMLEEDLQAWLRDERLRRSAALADVPELTDQDEIDKLRNPGEALIREKRNG